MSMDLPPLPPPSSIAKSTPVIAQSELPIVKGATPQAFPFADSQGLARSQGGTQASSTVRRANAGSFLDAFKFSGAQDRLSKESIAKMSLAERADVLRELVVPFRSTIDTVADSLFGDRSVTKDYRLAPAFGPNQKAIVRLLSSAKNAGEFDHLYSRVGHSALMMAVTGKEDTAVRALADKHHAVKRGDWASYFPYVETMAGIKSAGKNSIQFLIDGAEALPAMRDDLANNTFEHVIGTVFALQADDIGNRFVDRLGGQVKKGANVRWMLDEFGTNDGQEVEAKKMMGKMRDLGIDLTVNDTPGTVSELNHRKIAVLMNRTPTAVGTAVGYTGGMNIGNHYQGRGIDGHEHGWHDQTNRVQGPAVALLLEAVLQNWERDGGKHYPEADEIAAMRAACAASPEVPGGVDTWVIPHNGSGEDRNIKFAYLRAMATAKDTIRIANPYWGDRDIIDGLIKAAKDGVDVRVYFPAENDQAIMARTARAAYELLAEAGVKVFEVPGMSHLKVGAFDDVVMAGSSNLDSRSLEFNDELNLLWRGRAAAEDVQARLFGPDEARSKRITDYDATFREKLNLKLGGWT
jgi:cardiolipin synthase